MRAIVAMTIAGSDPSGGAGLQADLKTFHQHGVYGTAVPTLLTVQNTCATYTVHTLDADLVRRQIAAVLEDLPPGAIKTGALGNAAIIRAVAAALDQVRCPLVVDPILASTSGAPLLEPQACAVLRAELLPRACLITPNVPEAEALTGLVLSGPQDLVAAAAALAALGPPHVLIKGGHLRGPIVDVLWSNGRAQLLPQVRLDARHTHGTGCVLSAAITARLARGEAVSVAVPAALDFVQRALRSAPGLGRGHGPLDLHADPG